LEKGEGAGLPREIIGIFHLGGDEDKTRFHPHHVKSSSLNFTRNRLKKAPSKKKEAFLKI